MTLMGLIARAPDGDSLPESIGYAAGQLMEMDIGALTEAGFGETSADRLVRRNGDCDPYGQTRAGTSNSGSESCGRIIAVAVIVAVGVNMDGRREILGVVIGGGRLLDGVSA